MLDLHSDDAVVNHYADRYRNLMSANIRKTIQQMDTAEATALRLRQVNWPVRYMAIQVFRRSGKINCSNSNVSSAWQGSYFTVHQRITFFNVSDA